MHTRTWLFVSLVGAMLAGMVVLSHPVAHADEGPAVARRLSETGVILPLEKIAAAARAVKPGEILETELEREGKGYVYEVDILDPRGQVWEVKLDAKTGKLIKLESED